MSKQTTAESYALSEELKKVLHMTYLTRAKLEPFNANKYLLKDIWKNSTKKSGIHSLGWERPENIPFYPGGEKNPESYRASTSGGKYNSERIVVGEKVVEYDFNEAYTNILRNYALPSNTFLPNAKFDTEKIKNRLAEYDRPHPYRELKTFVFVECYIWASAKEGTFVGASNSRSSMLEVYGRSFDGTQEIDRKMIVSEIELKLIFDFYDVKEFLVYGTYTFRTKKDLLKEYFERVAPLKENELTKKAYKAMRNKLYGQISALKLGKIDENIFQFPMYNRAIGAFVTGVFREKMVRYEQKYVNSEYGLIMIKTDGLYFLKEVPEFEKLYKAGVVKKKEHVITEEDVSSYNVMG